MRCVVALDFQEIRRNALEDGIPLHEITVIFEGLPAVHKQVLAAAGVKLQDLADGKTIGPMVESQYDHLQEFATGVFMLSAD